MVTDMDPHPTLRSLPKLPTDFGLFAPLASLPAPSVAIETSEAAADSLTPERLGSLRLQVLLYIVSRGEAGATTDELEACLEGRHQTISPRVNELAAVYRLIERSSLKRPTRSGRHAFVYVATDAGKRFASR